ncbi:hypothetical protein AB0I28_15840 [Phytomonospora sp. NPDC050363]|uniref:hypothetical protein n=1 Tax=Phytomonospora sp. NPDC050363 TaxID=3155642 RepID=UPI003408AA9B
MKTGGRKVDPKLPIYVGVLVLAVLMGVGVGRVLGPVSTYPGDPGQNAGDQSAAAPPQGGGPVVAADGHIHGGTIGAGGSAGGAPALGGLEISASGYTLAPAADEFGAAGDPQSISFQILRADGTPATEFAVVHEKSMHFFVVRRDFGDYRHLHPEMAPDGTWSVEAALADPGPYRMYADFTAIDAAGTQTAVTLGADLAVSGDYRPEKLPAPAVESTVDGLTAAMSGTATPGVASPVLFTVTRDGRPVGLQPYLGAFGHLVALRDGDLGFVHVHPEPQLFDGAVKFWVTAPTPGTYRLYLDFQVDGKVHTADYVVVVE